MFSKGYSLGVFKFRDCVIKTFNHIIKFSMKYQSNKAVSTFVMTTSFNFICPSVLKDVDYSALCRIYLHEKAIHFDG